MVMTVQQWIEDKANNSDLGKLSEYREALRVIEQLADLVPHQGCLRTTGPIKDEDCVCTRPLRIEDAFRRAGVEL